jgi:phosphoenolpyruvate phosphomutase
MSRPLPADGAAPFARSPTTRTAQLRRMLQSPRLSARIVREAGFRGIWASGSSIFAQFGVRDNNEAVARVLG